MKTDIKKLDVRSGRQPGRGWGAIHKRLLTGWLAIGGIAVASAPALGAQGLRVVPSPSINNSTLSAAAIIADNDIWVVGDIGSGSASAEVTLAEHFGGTGWSAVPTPAVTGGMLSSVAGVAGNDVWAVGSQAAGSSVTALIEHWDGTSWTVVAGPKLPKGSFLTGVAAISPTDA